MWVYDLPQKYDCKNCNELMKKTRDCDGKNPRTRALEHIVSLVDKATYIDVFRCPKKHITPLSWLNIEYFIEYEKGKYFFIDKKLDEQPWVYVRFMKLLQLISNKHQEEKLKPKPTPE